MRKIIHQAAIKVWILAATVGSIPGAFAADGDGVPSPVHNNSMMASSPFTNFTIGAMVYMLLVGVLVATLLLLGFLVVNLGLMSKREQDRIGHRDPSDVGILKGGVWPPEADRSPVLPAEEEGYDNVVTTLGERPREGEGSKYGKRPAA